MYASLWEAELMETSRLEGTPLIPYRVRFPLGSGINGNTGCSYQVTLVSMYASLWEAELMETRLHTIRRNILSGMYASLWEAELMETSYI